MKKSHSDQHFHPSTSASSSGARRADSMIPLGSTTQQPQPIISNPMINPQNPPSSYPNIQPRTSNLLPPTHPQQVNPFDHHPQQQVNLPASGAVPSNVSNPFLHQSVQQYNTFYVAPGSTGSSHGMVSRSSDSSLQSGGYPMMTQSNTTTNGSFSIQNAMNLFNSTVTKYANLVQLANNDDRKRALKAVNDCEDIVTQVLEYHNLNNHKNKEMLLTACLDQMYLLFQSSQQQQNDLRYIYVSISYLAKKHVEVFNTEEIKQRLLGYLFLTNKHFGTHSNAPSGTNPSSTTTSGTTSGIGAAAGGGLVTSSQSSTTSGTSTQSTTSVNTAVMKKGTYLCLLCCDILYKLYHGVEPSDSTLGEFNASSTTTQMAHQSTDVSPKFNIQKSQNSVLGVSEWSLDLICALLNDSLEDRIWCEHEYAKDFVDSILTGVRDLDSTPVLNDVESQSVPCRYNDPYTLARVKEIIVSFVDQFRNNTSKKRIENIIRFCIYCLKVREVRSYAARSMESWLGSSNVIVVKYAKELLQRMTLYIREDVPDLFNEGDKFAFESIVNMKLKPANISTQVDAVCGIVKNNIGYPVLALRKFLNIEAQPHHKGSNTFKNLLSVFKAIPSYRERQLGYTLQEMVATGDAEYFKNFKLLTRKIIKHCYNVQNVASMALSHPPPLSHATIGSTNTTNTNTINNTSSITSTQQATTTSSSMTSSLFDFVDLCSSLFSPREQMKQQPFTTRKRWIHNLFELVRTIIITIVILHTSKEIEDQELRFKIATIQKDAIEWCKNVLPQYLPELPNRQEEYFNYVRGFLFFDYQSFNDVNVLQTVLGEVPPNPTAAFEQVRYWFDELPCEEMTTIHVQQMALYDNLLKYADAIFVVQSCVFRGAKLRNRLISLKQQQQQLSQAATMGNKPSLVVTTSPVLLKHCFPVSTFEVIQNLLDLCKFNALPQVMDEKIPFRDEIVLRMWYWNAVLIGVIIIALNPNTLAEFALNTNTPYPTFRTILERMLKNQLPLMEYETESEQLQREERDCIERHIRKIIQIQNERSIEPKRFENDSVQTWMDTFMIHEKAQLGSRERRVMPISLQRELRRYESEYQLGRSLRACRQPDFFMQMIQREPSPSHALSWIDGIIQTSQEEAICTIHVLPPPVLCEYLISIFKSGNNIQSGMASGMASSSSDGFTSAVAATNQSNQTNFSQQVLINQIIDRLRYYLKGSSENDSLDVFYFFLRKLAHEDVTERKLAQFSLKKLFMDSTTQWNADGFDWIDEIRSLTYFSKCYNILWETFSKLILFEADIKFVSTFTDFIYSNNIAPSLDIAYVLSTLLTQRKYLSEKLFSTNYRKISEKAQQIFYYGLRWIEEHQEYFQSNDQEPHIIIYRNGRGFEASDQVDNNHDTDSTPPLRMKPLFLEGVTSFMSIIYSRNNQHLLEEVPEFLGYMMTLFSKSAFYVSTLEPENKYPLISREIALSWMQSDLVSLIDDAAQVLPYEELLQLLESEYIVREYAAGRIYAQFLHCSEENILHVLNNIIQSRMMEMTTTTTTTATSTATTTTTTMDGDSTHHLFAANCEFLMNIQNFLMMSIHANRNREYIHVQQKLVNCIRSFYSQIGNDASMTNYNDDFTLSQDLSFDAYANMEQVEIAQNSMLTQEDDISIEQIRGYSDESTKSFLYSNNLRDIIHPNQREEMITSILNFVNCVENIDDASRNDHIHLLSSLSEEILLFLQDDETQHEPYGFVLFALLTLSLHYSLLNKTGKENYLKLMKWCLERSEKNLSTILHSIIYSYTHHILSFSSIQINNQLLAQFVKNMDDISLYQYSQEMNKNFKAFEEGWNQKDDEHTEMTWFLCRLLDLGSAVTEFVIQYIVDHSIHTRDVEFGMKRLLKIFSNIIHDKLTNNRNGGSISFHSQELQLNLLSGLVLDCISQKDPSIFDSVTSSLIFVRGEYFNTRNYLSTCLMSSMIHYSSRRELTTILEKVYHLFSSKENSTRLSETRNSPLFSQSLLSFIQAYRSTVQASDDIYTNSRLKLPIVLNSEIYPLVISCVLDLMEQIHENLLLQQPSSSSLLSSLPSSLHESSLLSSSSLSLLSSLPSSLHESSSSFTLIRQDVHHHPLRNTENAFDIVLLTMLSQNPYSDYLSLFLDIMSSQSDRVGDLFVKFILDKYGLQPKTKSLLRWMYCCFPTQISNELQRRGLSESDMNGILSRLVSNKVLRKNMTTSLDAMLHRLGHLLSFYSYSESNMEISNFAFSIFRQIAFLYPYLVIRYLDNILSLIETNFTSNKTSSQEEMKPVLRISTQILAILDALRPHIFNFREILLDEVLDVYFVILNQSLLVARNDQHAYVEFVSKFIDFICNYILYLMEETSKKNQMQPVVDQLNFLLFQKDLLSKVQEIFPEISKIKLLLSIIQQLSALRDVVVVSSDHHDSTTSAIKSHNGDDHALLLVNKKHFTMLPLSDEEIFEMRLRLHYTQFLTSSGGHGGYDSSAPLHYGGSSAGGSSSSSSIFASHLTFMNGGHSQHQQQQHLLTSSPPRHQQHTATTTTTTNSDSSFSSTISPIFFAEYSSNAHYNAYQLKTRNRTLMDTLTEIDTISQYEPGVIIHFVPQLLDLSIQAKNNRQVMEIAYQLLVRVLQHDSKQFSKIIPFYLDTLLHDHSNVREMAIKYAYDLFPFCNTNESKQLLLERLFVIAEKEPPRVLHSYLSPTLSQTAMRTLTKIIDMLIKIN